MKKRFTILFMLIMVLSLMISYARVDASPSQGSAGTSSTRAIKDEIVYAQNQDIYSMIPWLTRTQRTFSLTTNIFETLLYFDKDMQIIPLLATSWEWKDDVTLIFQLRENAYFHNGDLMTPEDVAYSLNALANEPYTANNAGWIDHVDATGDHEITIYLKAPYGAALGALCHPGMPISQKKYMEDPAKTYETMPIGTGPYKLIESKPGEYYKMVRHDKYWGGEVPTKNLTMMIVPEPSQRTIMLESGAIDVAYEIPMNDYSKVKENPELKLWVNDSMKIVFYFFNVKSEGPVGNKLVRQALLHAMDRDVLIEAMLYGYGKPATNVVVPAAMGYMDRSEHLKYDPELAKKLLAEAGYSDGCTITVWTSAEQNRLEMCQIYQAFLQEVGVQLQIEVMDQNTVDSRSQAGEDYGMVVHFFTCMPKHVDQILSAAFYTGMIQNYPKYSNPEFDKIADQVRSTPERDIDGLMKLCDQAYDLIFEDALAFPVYEEPIVVATNANLEGLQISQVLGHKFGKAVVYVD